MSKICPNCGKENPDDAIFCQYCGTPLESTKESSPSQQPNQTQSKQNPTPEPSIYQPNPDMTLYSYLQKLRSAFFWIFLGTILVIIPIIDFIGAIIILIGYILLISAFGLVSKTNLPHVKEYKSTRNWLLILLILSILVVVSTVALITSTYLLVSTSISSSPNPQSNPSILGLSITEMGIIISIVILLIAFLVIYLIAYLKLVSSLKYLSSDLSVQRLYNAGNYLFYALIISIISYILMPIFIYINISIFLASAPFSIFTLLGILSIPIVVAIVSYILELIAFYDAYTGIDEFLNRYRFSPSQHT